MRQFNVVEEALYLIGDVLVTQQFDGVARHRIVIDGKTSDPASYAHLTMLVVPQGTFASTTEYYSNLPRVFQIVTGHEIQ